MEGNLTFFWWRKKDLRILLKTPLRKVLRESFSLNRIYCSGGEQLRSNRATVYNMNKVCN